MQFIFVFLLWFICNDMKIRKLGGIHSFIIYHK